MTIAVDLGRKATKQTNKQKSNGQFQRNLSFFKVRGGLIFFRGGGGGSYCLFSIETPITFDFPGGGGGAGPPAPPPPLWICTWTVIVMMRGNTWRSLFEKSYLLTVRFRMC